MPQNIGFNKHSDLNKHKPNHKNKKLPNGYKTFGSFYLPNSFRYTVDFRHENYTQNYN